MSYQKLDLGKESIKSIRKPRPNSLTKIRKKDAEIRQSLEKKKTVQKTSRQRSFKKRITKKTPKKEASLCSSIESKGSNKSSTSVSFRNSNILKKKLKERALINQNSSKINLNDFLINDRLYSSILGICIIFTSHLTIYINKQKTTFLKKKSYWSSSDV